MDKVKLNVKLTGQFMKLAPADSDKGAFAASYPAGITLCELTRQLGVEGAGVKYTALVNNTRKGADYTLCESDSVTIMPLLAGG